VNGEHLHHSYYGARITNEVVSGELEWSSSAFAKFAQEGFIGLGVTTDPELEKEPFFCRPRLTSSSGLLCRTANRTCHVPSKPKSKPKPEAQLHNQANPATTEETVAESVLSDPLSLTWQIE